MGLLSNIGGWLGGLVGGKKPQPTPQPKPTPNYNLSNFIAQHLRQIPHAGVTQAIHVLQAPATDPGTRWIPGAINAAAGDVSHLAKVATYPIKVKQYQAAAAKGQLTQQQLSDLINQAGNEAGFGINDSPIRVLRKTAGAVAGPTATILTAGAGGLAKNAVLGKTPLLGRVLKAAAGGAGVGAGFGAVQLANEGGHITPGLAARDIGGGLAMGAGAGAAGPLAGTAIKGLAKGLDSLAARKAARKLSTKVPTLKPVRAAAKTAKTAGLSEDALMAHAEDPNLPPNMAKLPEYNLNKESWWRKAVMPTVDIIKRQGKAGQKLGALADEQVSAHKVYQADLARQAPTIFKLGREERANFGDVVEGKAKAVSQNQKQAVKEWKVLSPQIRDRGMAAGLEIGDRGPKYFPHMIDFDKLSKRNNFNVAVNHLVKTGQAKTPEEAVALLRQAQDIARTRPQGNLEASRLVDLPFYDKSTNAIGRYIHGASSRITQVEHFGFKDAKALRLITRIAREGGDDAAAREAFDVLAGAKKYNPTAVKVSNGLRKFNTLTKLGTAGISNAGQSVNTGTVAGYHRVLKASIDALGAEGKKFVQKSGVVADSVINDLANQQGAGGWVGKIGAPGFGTVEKANRTVAALAGRHWANDLAKKGGAKELKILTEKLGVTGNIGKELTEGQQIQAAHKLVEITQFNTGAKDLPGWANSPAGKLVAQFRTFPYKQGNFLLKEVLKPASQGNIVPLARFLAALPVGYGIYETKNILRNRPDDQSVARRVFESFQALGGAGVAGSIVQGVMPRFGKYLPPGVYASQVAGTFGGPTVSTAGRIADAIGSAATGNFTPAGRVALGTVPVIGGTLSNTILPYAGVGNRTSTAAAASSAPTPTPSTSGSGGALLTGDNTSPEYKQAQKDAKAQKAADLKSGKRLGGTEELDKAQQRIDTAEKNLPAGISQASRDILVHYAKLNDNGRAAFESDPRNKYLLETAKYEQDKKAGKLSTLEDFSRTQALGKLEVTSRYPKEAQTLYGMSKANRAAFLGAHPEYTSFMDAAAAMDAELAAKGWISKAKLSTGGGRSSASSRKYATLQGKIRNHPGKLSGTTLKGYKVKRVKIKP